MTSGGGGGTRLTFGEARVTAVVELIMPTSVRWLLPEHPDAAGLRDAAAARLRPAFMNERGHLLQAMQAFVVEADGLTVVVDTGIGNDKERPGASPEWHRRDGPFLTDLRAAGCDPAAVDLVVCTHMHVDHVGWNTRLVDGAWTPTFANARYVFARSEYDYWLAESQREDAAADAPPDGIPAHGAAFDDSVAPIVAAGLADLVDDEHQISPSIALTSSAGHTPGHVSVEIRSGGARALLIGDAMHSPVQCGAPDARPALDTAAFAEAARQRRHAILRDTAGTETAIAGSHFPPPGFGRVVRDGDAYAFHPLRGHPLAGTGA